MSLTDYTSYLITILSNQSGITLKNNKDPTAPLKRLETFKAKVGFVFNQLDVPISIYAATNKDHYRKPCPGMWKELLEDHDLDIHEGPNHEASFFVGDAAGRPARDGHRADHSCSDR
jgi:bifunctional polynucleotide phosphatase/kinase